jgi:hypothetical protein
MAHPWGKYLYDTLNMSTIPRYPNTMLKESHKWLPKFSRSIVIIIENHLYAMGRDMENAKV